MIVQPIPQPSPTFGWGITQNVSRYGKTMTKLTEYHLDNGKKLLVTDRFEKGVRVSKTKELFDSGWRLIKGKLINYLLDKGGKNVWHY